MSFSFQSLRSSSRGNCLLVSTGRTTILIDCGIKTQRECHSLLDPHATKLDAVLVSHAHGDHISYSALRVLQRYGTPILCHADVVESVERKHLCDWDCPPTLRCFGDAPFTIGDIEVTSVELPHEPWCPTYGFVLRSGSRTIVTCTDFHEPRAMVPHLADADFAFLEANHDVELLRLFPNYASRYHLSNIKTAALLSDLSRARCAPRRVMLGHLSEQRNSEELALTTIRERFNNARLSLDFPLHVAPRYEVSEKVHVS
jgi:phosphoribosyl 1,2-cyclic phosphodiesterase